MVQRLENFYQQQSVPKLIEQFHYKNKHQVPKLEKIVINRGLGDASQNAKLLESCSKELSMITGQQDFQGVSSKSFDGHGNYSLGLEEQLMFPEIEYDKIDQIRGMDVSIVTTANTDQEAMSLLKTFGMPFKN